MSHSVTHFLRRHAPAIALVCAAVFLVISPMFPPSQWHRSIFWGDAMINTYVVNWTQHILVRSPTLLYEMPYFHPQASSGAFTSMNPLLGLITSPLRIFGNPVLSYNLAMVAAALLTGVSMYFAAYLLTGVRRAAVLAGVVFAANGDMLWHLAGHPNLVMPIFLPWIIVGFWRLRESGHRGWLLVLVGSALAGFLVDWYLGFIGLFAVAALYTTEVVMTRRLTRPLVIAAIVMGLLMFVPYWASGPYRAVSEDFGNTRGLHDMTVLSADIVEYFLPPREENRAMTTVGSIAANHLPWTPRLENAQFFGYLPWILALAAGVGALFTAWRRRVWSPHARLAILFFGVAITGMVLSFGPFLQIGPRQTNVRLPMYWIYEYVSPLRFMRATSRFAVLVGMVVALSMATGLARWSWFNHATHWKRYGIFFLMLGIVVVEFFPVSTPGRADYDHELATRLANPEAGVIVSVPLATSPFFAHAGRRFSPTPSGHLGGVHNEHFVRLSELVEQDFGSLESLSYLGALGVETVVVYGANNVESARSSPYLQELEPTSSPSLFKLSLDLPSEVVAQATRRIAALPVRPEPVYREGFPEFGDYFSINRRIGLSPDDVRPIRYTRTLQFDVYEVDRFDLADASRALVRLKVPAKGIDFTTTKFYWITAEDPTWDETKSASTMIKTNHDAVWEIDLRDHSAWRQSGTITHLRIDRVAQPHPRQEILAGDFRLFFDE